MLNDNEDRTYIELENGVKVHWLIYNPDTMKRKVTLEERVPSLEEKLAQLQKDFSNNLASH